MKTPKKGIATKIPAPNDIKVPNLFGQNFADVVRKMASAKPISNAEIVRLSKQGMKKK